MVQAAKRRSLMPWLHRRQAQPTATWQQLGRTAGACIQGNSAPTCHHVHLLPLVPLHQQVDGVLEGSGVQQDGGHILELDARLQQQAGRGGGALRPECTCGSSSQDLKAC